MLRYGIVGAGFVSRFHLRALESVRGVEVAGITSRTPPHEVAADARRRGLGEVEVFGSVTEMLPHVDVVAVFAPNDARVAVMEEVAGAAHLRGVIVEKPLGRNLAEARRVVELAGRLDVPTAYFENQLHMKAVTGALTQLDHVARVNGPPLLARAAEEHAGPHSAWFWDPTVQGGGVLSDMGCHSIAVGRALLTPPGKPPRHLVPTTVSADIGLLKWGLPRWRAELQEHHGVDYGRTPAEDFATGLVTYRDPDTGNVSKAQLTVSWMYDKQGLRLSMDAVGPGYALDVNTLRSPLELFIGDAAAVSVADAERALEKATATRGLLAVQPNEPDLYGYIDEHLDAAAAFEVGRSARYDLDYGLDIVRLTMACYLSAEERRVVDLTDPATASRLESYVPLVQQGRGLELLAAHDSDRPLGEP